MKYEKIIEDSFESLNFKPRGNQVSIVNDVLVSFFEKNKRNVVLCAGTGIGKSVLGAVISDCVDKLVPGDALPSIISMGTNALAQQYTESFADLGKHKFFQIKGAANYPCQFLEMQPISPVKTADSCMYSKMLPEETEKYCRGCEFKEAKKMVHKTQNLITNYTYFMTAFLASGHLDARKLNIFDEAHVVNDAYCSFTEIEFTTERLAKYVKEVSDINATFDGVKHHLVNLYESVAHKQVNAENYMEFLETGYAAYLTVAKAFLAHSQGVAVHSMVDGAKFEKIAKKYAGLASKIKDFLKFKYDHVFDDSVEKEIKVKMIFVSGTIDSLLTTKNLFMSATITDSTAYDILGLNKDDTDFIMLPPVFPKENKPLFFLGNQSLNFDALKKQETLDGLANQVAVIVDHHRDTKGLIIVPSFYLGSAVVKKIDKNCRVFEHRSGGQKLQDLIKDFKSYKGTAVLVSPSIFEGLDFKNDDSRFQIIVKAPFASLGDKRIKYIATNYPHIYQEMALLKILQGIGRSVRTPDDFAATYFLDSGIKRLYDSSLNLWKDHYSVIK